MQKVSYSIQNAFRYLFHPKVLLLLFVPSIISIILWMTFGIYSWGELVGVLSDWLKGYVFFQWLNSALASFFDATTLLSAIASFILIFLFLPVMFLTSIFLISVFATPILVKWFIPVHYPALVPLQKSQQGKLISSIFRSVKYGSIFVVLMLLTIPLWLVPGVAIFLPMALGAWLNKKLLISECLELHATHGEIQLIEKKNANQLWSLGIIIMAFNYIPFGFIISPVLTSLAYMFFSFSALSELRSDA